MKIIIVGCGITGQSLIGALENEGHSIVAIDVDRSRLDKVNNQFDVMTVLGNGADIGILKEAGVENADLLIAMTPSDEQNILCSMTAKRMGVKNTVARVRNPEYEGQLNMFKGELGLSMHINPEQAFAAETARLLKFPSAFSVETFAKGQVELMGIKLEENNKLCNLSLIEMSKKFGADVLVCAVKRGEETVIPRGNFRLEKGDMIYVTASSKNIHRFAKEIGALGQRTRKVMIIGDGTDSFYLARRLSESGLDIKIITSDFARGEYLLENIHGISVAMGGYTDTDLLEEEGIGEADGVVCLTGNDEQNTMIAFFAKSQNKGVKVISRCDSAFSKVLMERAGLTDVVSPKYVASNMVTSYVRAKNNVSGGSVITLYKLLDGQVEALEFLAEKDSKIIGKPLKEMKIKQGLLIASVVRKDEIITPNGDTVIEDGDSVIVVTTNTMLDCAEDILA